MARLLCIDPAWTGGTPPDNLITRTIYSGVRFVARPDLWDAVGHYLELEDSLQIQLVIARESGDPRQYNTWGTSDWMIPRISWVIGNEMDGSGDSSWIMSPQDYTNLWHTTDGYASKRWIGGLCSGDPYRGKEYLQPGAAGAMVHIYTLDPPQAKLRVGSYRNVLSTNIWIGETHATGNHLLSDYVWSPAVGLNDFCYSDQMVPGMGLYA